LCSSETTTEEAGGSAALGLVQGTIGLVQGTIGLVQVTIGLVQGTIAADDTTIMLVGWSTVHIRRNKYPAMHAECKKCMDFVVVAPVGDNGLI
jgi:hypothetical protein